MSPSHGSMAADARKSSRFRVARRERVGTYTHVPVSEPDDDHGDEQGDEQFQGMESPTVPRRDEVDQSLERTHSGIRRGSASSLRAAVAQRGARGELRTAAAAERIDAHALRRHLAEDRPRHRHEEGKRHRRRRGRRATEVAPHGPRTHSADQLTQGLHRSLACNGCRDDTPAAQRVVPGKL